MDLLWLNQVEFSRLFVRFYRIHTLKVKVNSLEATFENHFR